MRARCVSLSAPVYESGGLTYAVCARNVNFGHRSNENSNWPALIWVIYGLSIFYYCSALLAALLAWYKMDMLTDAMKRARQDTIREAISVVGCGGLWLAALALFYYLVILHISPDILEHSRMDRHPQQYNSSDAFWVGLWAFIVGGHNIINFVLWRWIVIPRHNKNYGLLMSPQRGAVAEPLHELLRDELLFFTGLGIRSAVRYPKHEHTSDVAESRRRSQLHQV